MLSARIRMMKCANCIDWASDVNFTEETKPIRTRIQQKILHVRVMIKHCQVNLKGGCSLHEIQNPDELGHLAFELAHFLFYLLSF